MKQQALLSILKYGTMSAMKNYRRVSKLLNMCINFHVMRHEILFLQELN